jgi:hypothetical protein
MIFTKILKDAAAAGVLNDRSKESNKWLRDRSIGVAKQLVSEKRILFDAAKDKKQRLVPAVMPGRMYFFNYDPKLKATLPYYDQFPLIFPFRKVNGGFYGFNMHYLPPIQRAALFDAMIETVSNDKYDETTKLRLNYGVLAHAARFKFMKPCIKHYLSQHVRSRFIFVFPEEWQLALMLPTATWKGATQATVWKDSKKIWQG